jgi:hypothetical protein
MRSRYELSHEYLSADDREVLVNDAVGVSNDEKVQNHFIEPVEE